MDAALAWFSLNSFGDYLAAVHNGKTIVTVDMSARAKEKPGNISGYLGTKWGPFKGGHHDLCTMHTKQALCYKKLAKGSE
ncbi:hypothetical protein X801_05782, partial [Opisthorchis viverrini]